MSDTSTPWEGAGASGKMAPQELSPGSGEPVLGPGEKEMHLKVRRGLAPAGWDATLRKCQEAGRKQRWVSLGRAQNQFVTNKLQRKPQASPTKERKLTLPRRKLWEVVLNKIALEKSSSGRGPCLIVCVSGVLDSVQWMRCTPFLVGTWSP